MIGRSEKPERPSAKYYGSGSRNIDGIVRPEKSSDENERKHRFIFKPQRRTIIVFSALLLLGLLFGFAARAYQSGHKSVLPVTIKNNLTFPALVPRDNNALNNDSFSYESGTLSYQTIINNAHVVVTEQPQPKDFSLSNYVDKGVGISDINTFDTPVGKALTGTVLTNHVLIISTGKTIISATTPSTTSFETLHSFAESLQKD